MGQLDQKKHEAYLSFCLYTDLQSLEWTKQRGAGETDFREDQSQDERSAGLTHFKSNAPNLLNAHKSVT